MVKIHACTSRPARSATGIILRSTSGFPSFGRMATIPHDFQYVNRSDQDSGILHCRQIAQDAEEVGLSDFGGTTGLAYVFRERHVSRLHGELLARARERSAWFFQRGLVPAPSRDADPQLSLDRARQHGEHSSPEPHSADSTSLQHLRRAIGGTRHRGGRVVHARGALR